jgi:hypothetical protein
MGFVTITVEGALDWIVSGNREGVDPEVVIVVAAGS